MLEFYGSYGWICCGEDADGKSDPKIVSLFSVVKNGVESHSGWWFQPI